MSEAAVKINAVSNARYYYLRVMVQINQQLKFQWFVRSSEVDRGRSERRQLESVGDIATAQHPQVLTAGRSRLTICGSHHVHVKSRGCHPHSVFSVQSGSHICHV